MFGADAFGALAFAFVNVASPPLSFDPFIAHLVGREPAVALSGSEATFHVDGQQPILLTFDSIQVPS